MSALSMAVVGLADAGGGSNRLNGPRRRDIGLSSHFTLLHQVVPVQCSTLNLLAGHVFLFLQISGGTLVDIRQRLLPVAFAGTERQR